MEEPLTQTVLNISPQVFRMLGIYVRELSRETPPQKVPQEATPEQLRDSASDLSACRSDIENAVQTLGWLQGIDGGAPDRNIFDRQRFGPVTVSCHPV